MHVLVRTLWQVAKKRLPTVSLALKLMFNTIVSKKPKLSEDGQKSILARKRDKYVHKDKQVADVVEEICARMLSKDYNVWCRRSSKAAT